MLSDDDRAFKRKLDEEALLQQRRHVAALERALQQHEAVRRSAEHTYEAYQIEVERQRVAREAAQTRRLAEERRKLEEDRQAEIRRVEEARQQQEAKRQELEKLEQERERERELAQKKREDEAKARQKAEQERSAAEAKAREEEAAREAQRKEQERQQHQRQQQQQQQEAQRAQQTSQSASVQQAGPQGAVGQIVAPNVPPGLVTTQAEREKLHDTYLALHKQCKLLRREIMQIKSSNRQMYDTIRDNARHVKLAVGQLAKNDTAGNRKRVRNGACIG